MTTDIFLLDSETLYDDDTADNTVSPATTTTTTTTTTTADYYFDLVTTTTPTTTIGTEESKWKTTLLLLPLLLPTIALTESCLCIPSSLLNLLLMFLSNPFQKKTQTLHNSLNYCNPILLTIIMKVTICINALEQLNSCLHGMEGDNIIDPY